VGGGVLAGVSARYARSGGHMKKKSRGEKQGGRREQKQHWSAVRDRSRKMGKRTEKGSGGQ